MIRGLTPFGWATAGLALALVACGFLLDAKAREEATLRQALAEEQAAARKARGEVDQLRLQLGRAGEAIAAAEARGLQSGRDECNAKAKIDALPRGPDGRRRLTPDQLRQLGPRAPA